MNSSLASPAQSRKDSFIISEYLDLLTKSDKDKAKYICPSCEGHNLSINKNGKAYSCYDGCQGNEIAYALRELRGEFKVKSESNSKDPLQVYKSDSTKDSAKSKSSDDDDRKLNTNPKAIQFIKTLWGEDLAFNLRTLSVELGGKTVDTDSLHCLLADKYGVSITKDRCLDSVYYLAKQKEYDPFKNFLESCENRETDFREKGIALSLFKIKDPYYDKIVWLFLLAIVKRAYEPGCKWDVAFVLQGDQGVGKSTFFRVLSNGSFSDAMTEKLSVDDLRIMHKHAINEWSELDGFTAKTYEGKIKAFLSRQEDDFRLPYGRDLKKYPRQGVIVGSVNPSQFLTDMTGNRRFLVVPVKWIIPPDELECVRDEIWAGVIKDYKENWQGKYQVLELPQEYRERQKSENENHLVGDILEDAVFDYLEHKEIYVTMGEVMKHLAAWNDGVLGIRASDKGTQMRVGKIMNRLGWEKKQVWTDGQNLKAWYPASQN